MDWFCYSSKREGRIFLASSAQRTTLVSFRTIVKSWLRILHVFLTGGAYMIPYILYRTTHTSPISFKELQFFTQPICAHMETKKATSGLCTFFLVGTFVNNFSFKQRTNINYPLWTSRHPFMLSHLKLPCICSAGVPICNPKSIKPLY